MINVFMVTVTIFAFFITMLLVFWRPRNLNEAYAATIGAILVLLCGSVSIADLIDISDKVSGAAITIMATIVMAIVLESFGFFNWAAIQLVRRAKGSGIKLFWYTNLLSFLMTLFFNNDGSILITTPILLLLLNHLKLKRKEKIPYLISAALVATASSAPIGVSNIVNLIALEIIEMDLYLHSAMMFVPGTLGLLFLVLLLYIVFRKNLPDKITVDDNIDQLLTNPQSSSEKMIIKKNSTMILLFLFIFVVRISLFLASYLNVPVALVAVIGSLVLLIWRWYVLKISPVDMLKKTPWHILIFAYCMYVIIFGLHNIGLTQILIGLIQPLVSESLFHASLTMGVLLSILSNLFNNHPALMIGTIALTEMGLDPIMLKTIYLANIIGSDIGSLLLPIGTLAILIWMHILKKGNTPISWLQYIKVTIIVIPPTLIFTLVCLYLWIRLVFI
jgi:arsenical pump membrane protein